MRPLAAARNSPARKAAGSRHLTLCVQRADRASERRFNHMKRAVGRQNGNAGGECSCQSCWIEDQLRSRLNQRSGRLLVDILEVEDFRRSGILCGPASPRGVRYGHAARDDRPAFAPPFQKRAISAGSLPFGRRAGEARALKIKRLTVPVDHVRKQECPVAGGPQANDMQCQRLAKLGLGSLAYKCCDRFAVGRKKCRPRSVVVCSRNRRCRDRCRQDRSKQQAGRDSKDSEQFDRSRI